MIASALRLFTGIALAVVLSQFPEFVQQYAQRIGGHVDALRPIVDQFEASARRAGLTPEDAIRRLTANPDTLVVDQTVSTADAIERYTRLQRQRADLQNAGEFERLVVFLRDYDPEIAHATYEDYRPAVPTTIEGLGHAGAGFAIGYLGVGIPAFLMRRRRRLYADPRLR